MRLKALWAAAGTLAAAACWGVAVEVPVDGVTLNLGVFLQAGHYYDYRDMQGYKRPASRFSVSAAELRVYGTLWDVVDYNLRGGFNSSVTEAYLAVAAPANFKVTFGRGFIPFGNEATTQEWDLITNNRTVTSNEIAPGRNTGLRVDWRLERDAWPYLLGAAGGAFLPYSYDNPIVSGAGRVYASPVPGLKGFQIGASYLHAKEKRYFYYGGDLEEHYREAPRAGADLSYDFWRVKLRAEYMRYFVNEYLLGFGPSDDPIYKDDSYRGLFGVASYTQPLRFKYFQGVEPYARYERYQPAVLMRGAISEDRYTAGFALHFVGRNLTFRSDYTRILEDKNRTSNDEIASAFQVYF